MTNNSTSTILKPEGGAMKVEPSDGHVVDPEDKLTVCTKVTYAGPRATSQGMTLLIQIAVRPLLYIETLGMKPETMAAAIAICKSVDFLLGFVIGYSTDNLYKLFPKTCEKFGRRKPFVALGFPLWICAFLALCNPIEKIAGETDGQGFGVCDWSSNCTALEECLTENIAANNLPRFDDTLTQTYQYAADSLTYYFLVFYFLFYTLGISFTLIPYDALGIELTSDYKERASLFGYKGFGQFSGFLSVAVSTVILSNFYPDEVDRQISIASVFYAAINIFSFVALLGLIKNRPLDFEKESKNSDEVIPAIRSMLKNVAYTKYLVMKIPLAIAGLVPVNLLFFYVKFVLKEENNSYWTGLLAVITIVAALVSVPIIVYAAQKFGKRQALMSICLLEAFAFIIATFIPADRSALCIFAVFIGIGAVGTQVLPDAILADIIDYDTLHTLRHSEGTYTVLETNLQQYVEIFAGTLPLLVFSWVGYENNAGCDCGCGVPCNDDYLRWNCPGDIGYACSTDFDDDLIFGGTGRDPNQSYEAPCTIQSETVQWAIRVIGILIPGLCYVWAIIPVYALPITGTIHSEILKATEDRQNGKEGVKDPITGHIFEVTKKSPEYESTLRVLKGYFSRYERQFIPELQRLKGEAVDEDTKDKNLSYISRLLWFWMAFWILGIIGAALVIVNFQSEVAVTFCSLFLGLCFIGLPWEIARAKYFRNRYLKGLVVLDDHEGGMGKADDVTQTPVRDLS